MFLDLRFFYVSIIGIAVFGFNNHHVDMNAAKIIKAKKQGERVSDADLAALIRGYAAGEVPDYQMAAFAMAIIFQGMHLDETVTFSCNGRISTDPLWTNTHVVASVTRYRFRWLRCWPPAGWRCP